MQDGQWGDANMRCFGMLIDGRAQPSGISKRGGDATLLLIFNAAANSVEFKLPECPGGEAWTRLIDTNQPDAAEAEFTTGEVYLATERSVLVFGHPNESAPCRLEGNA